MNTRMMKKRIKKWSEHHNDQYIHGLDQTVNDAARYKGINIFNPIFDDKGNVICQHVTNEFIKFSHSRDVMRAVKSYVKKMNLDHKGKCRNVREMYANMCIEIHKEKEYRKRLEMFKQQQMMYEI